MEVGAEERDICYDTADLFGDDDSTADGIASVCGLQISVLEKSGLALTLIADHIFSPALVLSELICNGTTIVRDQRVLELGCGTGLVGLIALKHGASAVYLTDYDDESILCCPRLNLEQNRQCLSSQRCVVVGHTWGTEVSSITKDGKFDVVFVADLLWYASSHADILQSIEDTLTEDGEVWISSGRYTTCASDFFALAAAVWDYREIKLSSKWSITDVTGISNLDERKQNCLCWTMKRRKH